MISILLILLLATSVFAGDNAGAKFVGSPPGYVEVGPGQEIAVHLEADNLVGVKEYDILVELDPSDAFELIAWDPGTWTPTGVKVVDGAVEFGAATTEYFTGNDLTLGTLTLTTAADFTTDTEALIDVTRISLGPSSTDRDVFDTDDLSALVIRINSFTDPNLPLYPSVGDAIRTLRIAVGLITDPTPEELAKLDVDGKPGVTVGDALRLLRCAVGVPGVVHEPPQTVDSAQE